MSRDRRGLLRELKESLTTWTTITYPDESRTLSDKDGYEYAIHTRMRDGRGVVCAVKQGLVSPNTMSFMPSLCQQTRSLGATLVLFVGTGPYTPDDATAFNPSTVLDNGSYRFVESKQRTHVTIIDINKNKGVPFGQVLSNEVTVV